MCSRSIFISILLLVILIAVGSCHSSPKMYQEYFDSGKLYAEGPKKKDLKDGRWTIFYTDGNIISIENYKEGQKHGICTLYWHTPALKDLGGSFVGGSNYDQELKLYIQELFEYDKGIRIGKSIIYSKDGEKTVSKIKDGKRNGNYKTYYKTGELKEERKIDEVSHKGKITIYFPSGNLKEISFFENGRKNGTNTKYFQNGQVETQVEFISGKREGAQTWLREDGSVASLRHFKNGKFHGDYKVFYPDGKLKTHTIYNEGSILRTSSYDENGKLISKK